MMSGASRVNRSTRLRPGPLSLHWPTAVPGCGSSGALAHTVRDRLDQRIPCLEQINQQPDVPPSP